MWCALAIALTVITCGCGGDDSESHRHAGDRMSASPQRSIDTTTAPVCRDRHPSSSSITIASSDEPGARLTLTGRAVDSEGNGVAGVRIYAYHTDVTGVYSNDSAADAPPRLCGVLATDDEGRYTISTIKPGNYPAGGNPAHVHFELSGEGISPYETEVIFADDRYLNREQLRARMSPTELEGERTSLVRPLLGDGSGGYRCERDFLVERTAN